MGNVAFGPRIRDESQFFWSLWAIPSKAMLKENIYQKNVKNGEIFKKKRLEPSGVDYIILRRNEIIFHISVKLCIFGV